ncbi:OmpA family protein [Sneathiella sp.]|uniref:OmpA family protein n=1 Tax=Sneathiella sp. TaxID=1964365 RepID=UPI0026296EBB|nr:OmpA family protein [Sneathiella sp.]MDF2368136.1 OmpA family protein [Sneathiella sp.]
MTKLPAATYSLSLLASLAVSIPFAGMIATTAHAETSGSARPAVEVNLKALKYSGPQLTLPTRIIDGSSVIVLTPPSLQKKASSEPSQKIVKPLVKPALTLPETTVAAAKPVPVPPVNPEKLPEPAEETKFEDVVTPVVKMDTAPIPTAEVVEETKENVADMAAEKVAETADAETAETTPTSVEAAAVSNSDATEKQPEAEAAEEIRLAAISPDAGPTAATAASNANDNLTRILFAEGIADLPTEAQTTLQAIADQVKDGDRRNVQLLAYGSGNSVSAARRLSLGRALAVRSKLMDMGVDNKQIEVRALGQPEGDEPSDRVDLLMISR